MSKEIMSVLREDLQELLKRRSKAVKEIDLTKDITATRIALDCTRLIKDSLELINKYDWQMMHSEYYTDGKKQVAVWEQNGEGIIRNHKVWDIAETVMNNDSNYKIIGVDMSK